MGFRAVSAVTDSGTTLSAVTAEEMRSVDRVATETADLALLSMMENAGRNLARVVRDRREEQPVVVLAGSGGNGGGGLVCARHLANRDLPVSVVLDRSTAELEGVPARQCRVLDTMDVQVFESRSAVELEDSLVVDALVGYGLSGSLRGKTATLAEACSDADTIVSLDVPSGINATTGDVPGPAVDADVTLTLALPKTGLGPNAGELLLGDIAIPNAVYEQLEIPYQQPFEEYVVGIRRADRS